MRERLLRFTEPALKGREWFCRCFATVPSVNHDRFYYLRLQLDISPKGTTCRAPTDMSCPYGELKEGVKASDSGAVAHTPFCSNVGLKLKSKLE